MKNLLPSSLGNGEHGQSLVELALVVLLIMLLVAGIVDLGRALFYYTTLRDAAQEGIIFGSISPRDLCGIEGRAKSVLANSGRIGGEEITIEFGPDNDTLHPIIQLDQPGDCETAGQTVDSSYFCSGNQIQVTIRQERFPLIMPLLGVFVGPDLTLTSNVKGTILRPDCPSQ